MIVDGRGVSSFLKVQKLVGQPCLKGGPQLYIKQHEEIKPILDKFKLINGRYKVGVVWSGEGGHITKILFKILEQLITCNNIFNL